MSVESAQNQPVPGGPTPPASGTNPPAKVVGVDHVAISVRDLNRSVEFYTKVIGLKLSVREYQKPGIEFFLDCGKSLIGLLQGEPAQIGEAARGSGPSASGPVPAPVASVSTPAPFGSNPFGVNHVSFRAHTSDFDEAVETLKAHSVNIAFIKKREKSWSVYFYDPDGNKLEITAWPEEDVAR